MKILVALHTVMDLGGIINHTEQLIGGLKELGHEVHLKELVWTHKANSVNKEGLFLTGPSGIPHHQGKGWNFHHSDRIAYQGTANVLLAREILSSYDLIIWTVPVPSKNKNNIGNADWIDLYDLPEKVKQIAFIHDGNAKHGIPHILAIAHHLSGLACVHACAMNGASYIETPRAVILNPQEAPVRDITPWDQKSRGFVNMQTFKAWKHVHELIEAIRYMPPKEADELREVAGMGIEYRYMNSPEKCKEQYFHADGERFWAMALRNGMTHHDYWDVDEVKAMLQEARVLVDPSWSKKYAAIGGHWNRVVVDAMIHGCVPVARRMGMGDELFKAGEHYVEIPAEASPQTYADIVIGAGEMSAQEAARFREANLEILPLFDRRKVAEQVVALAQGELATRTGETSKDMRKAAENIMFEHFGALI